MFAEPTTVAVNCWVWFEVNVTAGGVTDTFTLTPGLSVIDEAADFWLSATLVAVTVTVCALVMLGGAV